MQHFTSKGREEEDCKMVEMNDLKYFILYFTLKYYRFADVFIKNEMHFTN